MIPESQRMCEVRGDALVGIYREMYHKGLALCKAVAYAQNQKNKLYLFLKNPDVEMTNNLVETTFKAYVINCKNFLFSDTEKSNFSLAIDLNRYLMNYKE